MRDDLLAFIEEIAAEPAQWHVNDCSAAPARWLRRRGFDIALPAYGSQEEARAVIARHGDLVATWDHFIRGCLPMRDQHVEGARMGDIAVIDTRLWGQIGGIVANFNVLLISETVEEGAKVNFRSFGPVRRFEKVWAVS